MHTELCAPGRAGKGGGAPESVGYFEDSRARDPKP